MSEREAGSRQRVAGSLDAAIDRAARAMLDVEPPPGLRGRVMDRIELHGPVGSAFRRKDRGARKFWLAAPVAAAAIIVVAIMAPWREATLPVAAPPPVAARVNPPIAPPPAAPTKMSKPPRTVTIPLPYSNPLADPVAPPAVVAAASIAAVEDVNFTAVEALAPPPSIAIDNVPGPAPSTIRSIEPAPLQIRALEITPLPETPRERREE